MTINVEINLRIPRVKDPVKNAEGYPINSADVRFIRELELPALPTPGMPIALDTRAGLALGCEVLRADWNEGHEAK